MSDRCKRHWFLAVILAGLVSGPQVASGCSVCFGEPGSPLALGLSWGIASLLGVVLLVLGGIASFFFYLAKRSARATATMPPVATVPPSPSSDS